MGIQSYFLPAIILEGLSILLLSIAPASAQTKVDVLSYHGSTVASNGVNANETQITPVSLDAFQKDFATAITDIPNLTGIHSSPLP